MSERIHIIGLHRSGTTIMKNLFVCFDNTWIHGGESNFLNNYPEVETAAEKHHVVTKSPHEGTCKEGFGQVQQMFEIKPNLKLLCMVRDPRDILASKTQLNSGDRPVWIDTNEQWRTLGDRLCVVSALQSYFGRQILFVRYEDLVNEPDKIQEEIAEFTNLSIKYKFSEWMNISNPASIGETGIRGMNGLRPLDNKSIGSYARSKDRERILEIVANDYRIEAFIQSNYSQ